MFDLEASFPKGAPIWARPVRELVPEDFETRATDETPLGEPRRLQKFKHRHQALARALATGVSAAEAAIMCSYAHGTVIVYLGDPAFRQLVAFYQENAKVQAADLSTRMSQIALEAAEELLRRVEDDPEGISVSVLQDLITKMADRTGYFPAAKSVHQHLHLNVADRLDSARKRIAAYRSVEHVVEEVAA